MSITQLGLTGTPSKQYSVTPKRAATTVTKSIGTSSRDYSTITAWDADLDNTLVYVSGDDAVGECYNDSTFTDGRVQCDNHDLLSATLTVPEAERHDGTAGTGVKLDTASTSAEAFGLEPTMSMDWNFEWLEITKSTNVSKITNGVIDIDTDTVVYDVNIRNCIIHSFTALSDDTGAPAIKIFDGSAVVTNCIIYGIENQRGSGAGAATAIEYNVGRVNAIKVLNCTVHDMVNTNSGTARGLNIGDEAAVEIRNCIVTDCDECYANSSPSLATMDYNISSDSTASGTGSITSVTTSDQYVSTVVGSEDLHLKSGSDAIGAGTDLGTTPDGVQYDIDGVDRDARGSTWDIGADQAAATITKTIGTAARDYSTMTLWEADLDSAGYQSGDDAVGECYNDSTFDESVTIDGGGTVGLNSGTITVAAGERHDGTAGTGARLIATTTRTLSLSSSSRSLKWLELDGNSTYIVRVYCVGGTSNYTASNLIVHSTKRTGAIFGLQRPGNIHNNIVYDIYESLVNPGSDFGCAGISFALSSGVIGGFVYNNTVYNIVKDNGDGTSVGIQVTGGDRDAPCRNNIAVDVGGTSSGTVQCFNLSTTGTISNNLSSDTSATGTGSITNAVTADQFVSIVSGSEDLHLKSGSDAIGAGVDLGTTPDGVQYDIDGFDRDAANRVWDIGADQAAATITKTIGTTARDYSTMTLWEADLDDSTVYQSGDDAVGECYNDSDFTETITVSGGSTVGLTSVALTAASTERHNGTAGTGVRVLGAYRASVSGNNTIQRRIEWIEYDYNGNSGASFVVSVAGFGNPGNATVSQLIVHDAQNSGSTCSGIKTGDKDGDILNCIIYDIRCSNGFSAGALGVYCSVFGYDYNILNCTVYNMTNDNGSGAALCYSGLDDDLSKTMKNCIGMGVGGTSSGTKQCFASTTTVNADYSHNLSSDTSAPGASSVTNSVTADQFVSTVGGSEDLHLKAGADAIGAGVDLGTTPDGVQYDIDGVDRDARGTTWDIGADQAAGTVGKTIGTAARDYSTMTLWEADLDLSTVYQSGDDAVGECYNDSTFDETVAINGGSTVGLNSCTLTVANGEKHDGTAGNGARIVRTANSSYIISNTGSTQTEISWLEIDANGFNATGMCRGETDSVTSSRLKNLIAHGQSGPSSFNGFLLNRGSSYCLNNILYDCINTLSSGGGNGFKSGSSAENWHNNTCYLVKSGVSHTSGSFYGMSFASITASNNISVDSGTDGTATGADFTGTSDYSLSSDSSASGTSVLTNKTSTNQFVSIVSGSEDLHLKSGSDAIGAGVDLGTTPDGVQYDIDGFDRDAANRVWDIGADQAAATVTKTIGTTARDYSTMTLWEADLDDATVYQSGDDAVGECYNDSTFTENVTIDGGATVGLDSVSLGVANGENHDGTAGTGVRIVGNYRMLAGIALSPIVFTISDIENSLTAVSTSPLIGASRSDVNWLRCIVHHSHAAYAGQINSIRINRRGAVMNCIVYGTLVDRDVSLSIGILASSESDLGYYGYVYNNTVYNVTNTDTSITIGGARGISLNNVDLATHTIAKNNICVDTDTPNDPGFSSDIYFTDTANPAPYNLTSDDTGDDSTSDNTGALINKVSSDQFVSIVSGSEDLHLKAGADAIGAGVDLGTTPAGVEIDIDGRDRDAEGDTWDIGADQSVGFSSGSLVQLIMYNRRLMGVS